MAFGTIKADTIAYTDTANGNVEATASVETLADNANAISTNTTNIASNTTAIAGKAPLASPQFTGIPVATGDGSSTDGQIQLNCSQNSHGVKIKSPPHSANASYTLTLPDTAGTNGYALTTDGSGALSWSDVDVSAKADIASPTFTGTPEAPTAAQGTNTEQLATTEYVQSEIGQSIQAFDNDTAKTDVAQTYTAGQRGTITELSAGTSFDLNFASSNNFLIQPNGTFTVTLNASGLSGTKGQSGSIFISYQSGATTSGSFPTTMKFVGGAAGITLTGTGLDRIDYIVQDDTSGSEVITCNVTNNYIA